jgi:RHS repeat-associated protein
MTTGAGRVGYTYGPQGELTSIQYPSGRVVRYDLDGAGRVEQVRLQWPDLSESVLIDDIEYSPMSQAIVWRFANGLQVDVLLDARQRTQHIGVGNSWSWQAGGYDGADNLLGRTVDGIGVEFTYDPLDRLVAADSAGRSLGFSYDLVGNRLTRTRDGVTETASYEAGSNRLRAFGDRQYELDPNGNTTRMEAGASTTLDYIYAPHNRLIEILDVATSAGVASYRYDAIGQRVGKTTPDRSLGFVYGRNGELLAVLDESGNTLHEYVYLDGQPVIDLGQLSETPPQEAPAETIIDNDQASFFGANWQSKSSVHAINGSFRQNRKRDDRVVYWYIDETGASGTHDIFVRWVNPPGDGSRTNYDVRVRNEAGNGYDRANVGVIHDDHAEGDWVLLGNFDIKPYNPNGRQYVELSGFYNPYGSEGTFLEADAIRLVPTFVPGGSSDIKFIHNDHLGTPHAVTDESGQLVWKASYQPFGEAEADDDVDGDGVAYELNLRFPGQYYDAESGLHYNYFRDYDPSLGRYIESDPSGLQGGVNTYAYVAGNPVRITDPLGLAYFAFRPLSGLESGSYRCASGTISDRLNLQGSHEQLFFEDGEHPTNLGFFSDSLVREDDPGNLSLYRCRTGKYDDCIMRKAAEVTEGGEYCLIGIHGHNNCQDWAERVRANYAVLEKDPRVQKQCPCE